jgi:hypothetical protein
MNQTRGTGLEDEDSFEDPNFDQDGKALWGVPGAGAYETVTSIGKTAVFHNAPDYTFGVLHKKKPFVSKQHDINDYGGCDSPGTCARHTRACVPLYHPRRGTARCPDFPSPLRALAGIFMI